MAQATQAWADAKDEAERKAGLKPCCPLCRTDSHTEGQCVAARIRQVRKRKSSAGQDSKPGNVSIRKKKNFKRFKPDLQQVVLQGKNTDDVQYVLEIDGYSHLLHAICCQFLALLLRVKRQRVIAWPGHQKSWISRRNFPVRDDKSGCGGTLDDGLRAY